VSLGALAGVGLIRALHRDGQYRAGVAATAPAKDRSEHEQISLWISGRAQRAA
jgi:hypothetical protein